MINILSFYSAFDSRIKNGTNRFNFTWKIKRGKGAGMAHLPPTNVTQVPGPDAISALNLCWFSTLL